MSSQLLIDEPPLQVLPSLAVAVGLNEAVILQQVHYWLKIKKAAPDKFGDTYRDGRHWVYNSVREWQEQFPFWSDKTIQRALATLREKGLLIVAQLATDTRDRTNWYTIDYDALEKITGAIEKPVKAGRGQSTGPKRGNALPQNVPMADAQNVPMADAQNGAMHGAKTGQCLTETSPKSTQKIHQRVTPPGADAPPPGGLPPRISECQKIDISEQKKIAPSALSPASPPTVPAIEEVSPKAKLAQIEADWAALPAEEREKYRPQAAEQYTSRGYALPPEVALQRSMFAAYWAAMKGGKS